MPNQFNMANIISPEIMCLPILEMLYRENKHADVCMLLFILVFSMTEVMDIHIFLANIDKSSILFVP